MFGWFFSRSNAYSLADLKALFNPILAIEKIVGELTAKVYSSLEPEYKTEECKAQLSKLITENILGNDGFSEYYQSLEAFRADVLNSRVNINLDDRLLLINFLALCSIIFAENYSKDQQSVVTGQILYFFLLLPVTVGLHLYNSFKLSQLNGKANNNEVQDMFDRVNVLHDVAAELSELCKDPVALDIRIKSIAAAVPQQLNIATCAASMSK